jgi:2-polyprenyl-3-methyl-5-hydroxy-6-metoxy-1,4-benzoquinol methylase
LLGSTVDYWLLRPFTHKRDIATEEEMNRDAVAQGIADLDAATRRVQKLQTRLRGHLPIHANRKYLDVGCGNGDLAIALKAMGAAHVTGIDMVPRYISAAIANKERLGMDDGLDFVCVDIHDWRPEHRYDVILSHEALEHIRDPKSFLRRIKEILAPGGIAVFAFGPLFHSPFGDHMNKFFRVPIPWKGVIFSESAILRLRRETYRPTDPAVTYPDITGGLNLMRYSEFLRYAKDEGWKFDFLDVNPQLRRVPPLYWVSAVLTRTPGLRDYFASSIYTVLRPT